VDVRPWRIRRESMRCVRHPLPVRLPDRLRERGIMADPLDGGRNALGPDSPTPRS